MNLPLSGVWDLIVCDGIEANGCRQRAAVCRSMSIHQCYLFCKSNAYGFNMRSLWQKTAICIIIVIYPLAFGLPATVSFFVSFLCPWGCFGDPGPQRAPPKGSRRKSDEKVGSLAACWPPQGVPLGSDFLILLCFSEFFLVCFSKRFWEGSWGLWGPPPTMKMMVSLKRNHRLHISTWSSKTIENVVQRVPFGTPLGGFGCCWGPFWGMRK